MPASRIRIAALLLALSVFGCISAAQAPKNPPTWYVFRIKQLSRVTHSANKTYAIVEGVTIKDKPFKIKLVWSAPFKNTFPKSLDRWMKLSKENFAAGVPYVIAGKVIARDPLTIEPDTVVSHAPRFGAPQENVF